MAHRSIRTVSLVLVWTFSIQQAAPAADVRQLLLNAKTSFEEDDARRAGGEISPEALAAAEAQAQSGIDQQEMLQDLEAMNFSLKTQSGDVLKYVGDRLSRVERPDGTILKNITQDTNGDILTADMRLADGSIQIYQNGQVIGYQIPDGRQALYENGQVTKVIDQDGTETLYTYQKDGAGDVVEIVLDSPSTLSKYDPSGILKEVTRKSDNRKTLYSNGMIEKIVSTGGEETLFTFTQAGDQTIVSPVASNVFTDGAGNRFYFSGTDVTKVVLADGAIVEPVAWDADGKVQDATLKEADGARFIYEDGRLTRSYDAAGVLTSYAYPEGKVTASTGGAVHEYLEDGTALKHTALDGTVSTFYTAGPYKGLKETELLSSGLSYVYDYQTTQAGDIAVQKRQVRDSFYNITTFDGQSVLANGTNPALKFDVLFENNNAPDPSVQATATYSTTKNLKVNLVPGSGSSYTYNGVTKSLGVVLNRGTTYKTEVRWETGRIGIYVYGASLSRPSTPLASITDRNWDPRFKVVSTNAPLTRDATSSGYYNRNMTIREKSNAYLPGSPVLKFDLKALSASYKDINLRAYQAASGYVTRTITFTYYNSKWTSKVSDYNSQTGVTTSTTADIAQAFALDTSYIGEVRVENQKANLYVYAKGSDRPATPWASLDAFNVSTRLEGVWLNGEAWGGATYNLATPAVLGLYAQPLTTRRDAFKDLAKPAVGSSSFEFASITYGQDHVIREAVGSDGSIYRFENGLPKEVVDPSGQLASLSFEESVLSNLLGSRIVQGALESSYDAEGRLSSIKVAGMTVRYKRASDEVDFIESADGTEVHDLVFDSNGDLVGARVIAPDGEERVYENGRLVSAERPDHTKLFYFDDKPLTLVTADALTYNFTYTPDTIEAVLDASIVPAADAIVRMQYDTDYSLEKIVRQNAEVFNYLDDELVSIEAPEGAARQFLYTKDEAGAVLSYRVVQGNAETFYDANDQATRSLIHATAENPHEYEVLYRYGRIRSISKDGVEAFSYSYTFDGEGNEFAVVEDFAESAQKTYRDGKLLTSLSHQTALLSSYSYAGEKVSRVEVSRFGRNLRAFDYSYDGDLTVVRDEEDASRWYAPDGRLAFIEKSGEKFAYSYDTVEVRSSTPVIEERSIAKTTLETSFRSKRSDGSNAWVESSGALYSNYAGQYVEYEMVLSEAGDLKLNFEAVNNGAGIPASYAFYNLDVSVDGQFKGTFKVPAHSTVWQAGEIFLAAMDGGAHTIRIKWTNDYYQNGYDANFKFRNLSVKHLVPVYPTTTEEIVSEKLVEKKLSDGAIGHYTDGRLDFIRYADGAELRNVQWNADGTIAMADVTASDGTLYKVSDSALLETVAPDGTRFDYEEGRLARITEAGGRELLYRYDRDAAGDVGGVIVSSEGLDLRYAPTGELEGVGLQGIPNDVDGTVDLKDSSSAPHNINAVGDTKLSSTTSRLGRAAGSFDGTGDYLKITDNPDDFNFAGNDWTIDTWVYPTDTSGHNYIFSRALWYYHWGVSIYNGYIGSAGYEGANQVWSIYGGAVSTNAWHHVALVRAGSSVKLFLDGVQTGETSVWSGSYSDVGAAMHVGMDAYANADFGFNGSIDEFRVSKGLARWTSNFTSPTEAAQADAYTKLLLHFDGKDKSAYAFSEIKDASGGVTGYRLTGDGGVFEFDPQGAPVSGDRFGETNAAILSKQDAMVASMPAVLSSALSTPYAEDLNLPGALPASFAEKVEAAKAGTLSPDVLIAQEYSAAGELETQTKADGTVTLFESNRPTRVLGADGEILIEYAYDADGHPSRVYLKNARDKLPDELLKAQESIETLRAESLKALAAQKNLAYQSIQSQSDSQRALLQGQLGALQGQYDQVANTDAKGKKAKNQRGDVLNQIGNAIADVKIAMIHLGQQEAQAYAALDSQVQAQYDSVQADADAAYTELAAQEAALKAEILRQEVSPIVYDRYRRVLGRDPGSAEYDEWVARIDYASGGSLAETKATDGQNLTVALASYLAALPELGERQAYANDVKNRIRTRVNAYLAMSDAQRQAFATSLGLGAGEVVPLSAADAAKILEWLDSRSLHFGQSAFLSLEAILDQKGISYAREDIAEKVILVDILSGVITPLDDGDLVLSIFALNKVAALYGLNLSGANLSWEDLQNLYSDASAVLFGGRPRIIAHINGNHFVIITAITADSVTYIDPGIGKDKENESVTLAKADLLKVWENAVIIESVKMNGVASAPSKILSASETQKIRGAFLPFLFAAIWGAIHSIGAAVAVVLSAVGGFIQGVGVIVGNALAGIGQAIGGALSQIGYLGKSLFLGIKSALGSVAGWAKGLFATQTNQAIFGSLAKASFGEVLLQSATAIGINFGVTRGLDALGVNPLISGIAGAFAGGGIVSSFGANAFSLGAFFGGGVKGALTAGTQTLLNHVGVDPNLSSVLSLVASPLVDGIRIGDVAGEIVKVMPEMAKALGVYGATKLGEVAGLSSNLAYLVGAPISSGLIAGFQAGQQFGNQVIQSVRDAATSAILGYGVMLAVDQTAPGGSLASALLARTVTGMIDGALNPEMSMFQGAFRALGDSLGHLAESSVTMNFSDMVSSKGLIQALEDRAAVVFTRDALEEIVKAGGLAQILDGNARYTEISFGGGSPITVKEVTIGSTTLYYSALNDQNLYGRRIGNRFERGYFAEDAEGNFGLRTGEVEVDFGDGFVIEIGVEDYSAVGYEIKLSGKTVLASSAFDGEYDLGPNLVINQGVLENAEAGMKAIFREDRSIEIFIQGPEGDVSPVNGYTPELSKEGVENFVRFFALSNGINNTLPEGQLPQYMQGLKSAIESSGSSNQVIIPLAVYENSKGGLIGGVEDSVTWMRDVLGSNEITNEIIDSMNQAFAANPDLQVNGGTMVFYSGAGTPGLKAIDKTGYNVKSVVLIGTPMAKFTIENPHTDTIVQIVGERDILSPVTGAHFYAGHYAINPIANEFKIRIKGVEHTTYMADITDLNVDPKRVALTNEIARVISIADNATRLTDYLLGKPTLYAWDSDAKVYIMDPDKLPESSQ